MLKSMTVHPRDITCGELGVPPSERWSESVALSPEDREAVAALEVGLLLQTRPVDDAPTFQLAGTDRVGFLQLPSGRRVVIRPKAGAVALLDWLAYLGDCPPLSDQLLQPAAPGGADVHDLLAALYVRELERLTALHLRTDYVRSRVEAATVRGRVLAGALARGYHRLPAVPQAVRTRSPATPHNRLLAKALDRVAASAMGIRHQALALLDAFADIPRAAAGAVADSRWACPPGYGPAVQLASLILSGSSPDSDLHWPGPAFLVSLSSVWERALRRMLHDVRPQTGWNPVPDARRTRRWHDGPGLTQPMRWMTADAVVESPRGSRWVLDAKYKPDFGGDEDRHDRFQVTAYAMAFDAGRGSLVYPTGERSARSRLLLAGHVGGRRVTIDSIELPMSAGPGACREALRRLM